MDMLTCYLNYMDTVVEQQSSGSSYDYSSSLRNGISHQLPALLHTIEVSL